MLPYFQDNSPIHTCSCVKRWFESNTIRTLQWPSNAADLNPIENVWALWKSTMKYQNIKTTEEVWRAAISAWNNLQNDQDLCKNLIDSMPRRLEEVILKNGNYTSY